MPEHHEHHEHVLSGTMAVVTHDEAIFIILEKLGLTPEDVEHMSSGRKAFRHIENMERDLTYAKESAERKGFVREE